MGYGMLKPIDPYVQRSKIAAWKNASENNRRRLAGGTASNLGAGIWRCAKHSRSQRSEDELCPAAHARRPALVATAAIGMSHW